MTIEQYYIRVLYGYTTTETQRFSLVIQLLSNNTIVDNNIIIEAQIKSYKKVKEYIDRYVTAVKDAITSLNYIPNDEYILSYGLQAFGIKHQIFHDYHTALNFFINLCNEIDEQLLKYNKNK